MKSKSRFSNVSRPAIVTGIVLFIICGISLYIRIAYQFDQIFVDGEVWFKGMDPWYHIRLVDNLLTHFPQRISFDPYTSYPNGATISWPPFYDWLVAGSIKLFGGINPSQYRIDVIAAFIPPVMGTLTLIPVFFIGKELFNRWVGLLAAAVLVVLPGEFLNRSLLGFTDHHVAESLFSTTVMLFLILAIRKSRERKLSFSHVINRDWQPVKLPLVYISLTGFFLGLYLLSWVGGLMFLFILFAWIIIQFTIGHLRGESTEYLCIIGALIFIIATILFAPALHSTWISSMQYASLGIAVATPLAMGGISYFMKEKGVKPVYFPLLLLALAAVALILFYIVEPSLLRAMFHRFSIFTPGKMSMTILEANPLFFSRTGFVWNIAWINFATSFFIAIVSLVWLIYLSTKKERADWTLFLLWSIVMLAAVLGQRRFSYYYAVNAALLTGYFGWRFLKQAGLEQLVIVKEHTVRTARKAKRGGVTRIKRSFLQPRGAWFDVMLAGVAIFFLVFFPCVGLPGIKPNQQILGLPIKTTQAYAGSPNAINRAWYDSLLWLKDNSPEPFGSAHSYYELYQAPVKPEKYQYPESAYGIVSWWDYGHWITRVSHRIPVANPFQTGVDKVSRFFITQNIDNASEMMDELDSKYIITDYKMTGSIFYAIPTWAGKNSDDFFELFFSKQENGVLNAVSFYYPNYYQSAVVRLHNFDGKAAKPDNSAILLTYEDKMSREGILYHEITSSFQFSSYAEAQAYAEEHEYGKYVFGNFDPFVTPVPLKEMEHYKLVYESEQKQNEKPAVKIFEYTP